MQREALARILRKIAAAIEKSNVAEWDDFDIELRPRNARAKLTRDHEGQSNRKPKISPQEVEYLLEQLNRVSTREAASELLERLNLTRKELIAVARPRNVHVTKDDNVQKIKEKLVESVVGSRLNSLAIRGT
jgi:hypothetical protein